jgi:hypothetical protein
MREYMQVKCKYHAILYKELEHFWILVSARGEPIPPQIPRENYTKLTEFH